MKKSIRRLSVLLAAALLAEVCTSGCSLLTQSNLNGPASGPEVSDSEKSDANKVIIENDFGYVVKDGYAMIVYYAGDLSATEVNIPATIGGYPVRENKEYLLSDMVSLKKLTIPQGVTEIGKYAFVSCESLEELTFPEGLTALSEGVCKYCKSLKVVTIPSTLTSVGDYAFAGCSSLETAIFPDGVNKSEVPQNAFSGCTSLRNCNLDIQVQTAVSYGITGTFPQCKEWTTDIPLTDEDGDGIFTVVISGLPAMSYQFKVRVNGEWTDSWGELDDGVTYNSQNNCNVEVKENETLFVYFDTTVGDRNLWPVKYESR